MARRYRPVRRDQVFLLPPDKRDWLPEDQLVWLVIEIVETLDVPAFEASQRRGGTGAAGHDPRMLLGLLVYAYCRGVRSSHQVERLCHTDIAFKVACAGDVPDRAGFRALSEDAFAGTFAQVLLVAAQAGIARFGTIAIDGTKIPANASIDANRGRDSFAQHAKEIADGVVEEAQRVDAAEDALAARGAEDCGDRVPGALTARSERIRLAAAELAQQQGRMAIDREAREAGAPAKLTASQTGQPMRGRIPEGPFSARRGEGTSGTGAARPSGQARAQGRLDCRGQAADGAHRLSLPRSTPGSFGHAVSSLQPKPPRPARG